MRLGHDMRYNRKTLAIRLADSPVFGERHMRTMHTNGKPFDRGTQQAKQCADLAGPWFQRNLAGLRQGEGQETAARANVNQWLRRIGPVRSDVVDECRGLAAGLGLTEQEYFAAILLEQSTWLPMACTTCAVVDDEGHPIIAKTDDIYAHERGLNVLEVTRPDHGYRHVHMHFAGTIWTTAGINEAGLAIAMTGIPGATTDKDGLPSLFVLRTILAECGTATDAVSHVEQLPMNAYGFSLTIADHSGAIDLIEATSEGVVSLGPDSRGFRVHTNHILNAEFAARNPPQAEPVLTNGSRRLKTANTLLEQLSPNETGLSTLLRNRDRTGAISQEGEDGLHTDYAVILNPCQMQMTLWHGPPSVVEPEQIDITDLLTSSPKTVSANPK